MNLIVLREAIYYMYVFAILDGIDHASSKCMQPPSAAN
jgi:hypothetical protein